MDTVLNSVDTLFYIIYNIFKYSVKPFITRFFWGVEVDFECFLLSQLHTISKMLEVPQDPKLTLQNHKGILIKNNKEVQKGNMQGINNYTYILCKCLVISAS